MQDFSLPTLRDCQSHVSHKEMIEESLFSIIFFAEDKYDTSRNEGHDFNPGTVISCETRVGVEQMRREPCPAFQRLLVK